MIILYITYISLSLEISEKKKMCIGHISSRRGFVGAIMLLLIINTPIGDNTFDDEERRWCYALCSNYRYPPCAQMFSLVAAFPA